jgi:hypothetical protein
MENLMKGNPWEGTATTGREQHEVHFLNECFNSILLVFYMFRTSCAHHQEHYIVHAALYGMFFMYLGKHSTRMEDVRAYPPTR